RTAPGRSPPGTPHRSRRARPCSRRATRCGSSRPAPAPATPAARAPTPPAAPSRHRLRLRVCLALEIRQRIEQRVACWLLVYGLQVLLGLAVVGSLRPVPTPKPPA